jgi:acyl transferase domain-containing protein/NADPH:quinone reductase-like Zn-dependent oxidoreductase/NAD(P)-dependent dehydrogenase (short-subunit alcohol dehydrogenase family)
VGHLEGASGLAGIIKATMSVESAKIFPNMHFKNPNPDIAFDKLKIQVPTELMDWKSENGLRRASVNSFGYGGSNAHVILENYRPGQNIPDLFQTNDCPVQTRPFLIPLTSHTEKAGKLLASGLSGYIQQHPDLKSHDLAYSLSARRSMHRYRSFAIGSNPESILQDLTEPKPTAKWTRVLDETPRIAFVFTGQGAQWHAMGRQLIEQSPLFRQTLERCDEILQRLPDSPDWCCVTEFLKSAEDSRLSQSRISQPLCAALQLGLVELLHAWGIKPSAVVGHSSGEIVAAYAAGLLSFEESIICAYYRGFYMSKGVDGDASPRGAMMAVGLTESEGRAELKAYEGRIALAAINSPSSLTLSGDEDAIVELEQVFKERKVFVRRLRVEQAFHSHHMVPLAPAFEKALSNVLGSTMRRAKCQLFSSVTARDSSARKMDAAYWAANMTGVVRFSEALTGILLDDKDEPKIDALIEIGAHPALQGPSKQIMKSLKLNLPYVASLTRETPAFESLLATAGQLSALGYPVDLAAINSTLSANADGQVTRETIGEKLRNLPTYSWDHGKFWAETRVIREQRLRRHRHSVLGAPVPGAPANHPRWRNYLRQSEIPWLSQHVVDGKTIFPAAGYICMAIEAISTLSTDFKKILLRDVMFKAALTLSGADVGTETLFELQPVTSSAKGSSRTWHRFIVYSFDENYRTIEHCHGLISAEKGDPAPLRILEADEGFTRIQKASHRRRPRLQFYERLRKLGLQYGEDFQLLSGDIESGPGFAIAPLTFQPAQVITMSADRCILHPTILDASFHVIFASIETQMVVPMEEAFVPTFIRSMAISGLLKITENALDPQNFWVKSDSKLPGSRVAINQLSIQAENSNEVLVDMKGFEVTALGNDSAAEAQKRALFFQIKWKPAFDQLGRNDHSASFSDIAEVMDTFVHQFPDCQILHLTPSLSSTKEVLRHLGGNDSQPRRFQSITPYSGSTNLDELRVDLETQWPGLVGPEELMENQYDVIVVSESVDFDITKFLKEDGFIIVDGVPFDAQGLIDIFRLGRYSSFRKSSLTSVSKDSLTLLVSPRSSDRTKALCSSMQGIYHGAVKTMTVEELLGNVPSSPNIISLVSLDENLFFDRPTEDSSRYQAIKSLLTSSGNNIVWMLHGATHETPNPAQALMLGLTRTVRSENEDIRLLTLDVPDRYDIDRSAKCAIQVLDRSFAEDEVSERDGVLLIPRVEVDDKLNRKLPYEGNRKAKLEPFRQNRKLALKIGKVGLLDTLQFEDDDDVIDSDLADDDLEVEVKASALNFRDIAASIGIIDDYRLGDECSGIVIRTGRNVKQSEFKPGDRVIACRPGQGAHRSVVRNPAMLCQKIGAMDFVTAASFEGVLSTAYYSLVDIARLQPGEYCLIHSAAGGVGQMAIQLVQMIGGKVIATVGSQSKRDYLKEKFGLKDEMIFSSRDPSFVEGVLKVTNGRGCDVALNSLAGELLHATWGCIAPFGRLIEIGKRDIHENSKLDMDPFRKNIAYASVDIITLFLLNKPLLARIMHDCYQLIADGKIMPPGPITEVSYAEAQRGFRLLQMGKYFGKVVLVPGENDLVPVVPASYRNSTLFEPTKSYLLVGGLGGIGRALAEWMFRKGARKLIFLSRTGVDRSDAKATAEWLTARDVTVSVFRGDVADMKVVEECIKSTGNCLAGIFHAAMVLRDTPFAQMNLKQWQECVHPKVRGAYNLHKASIGCNLDFFICFSSGASVLGSMAQANYAAANSYLDALMRHRREQGLQGTTMNVGMVSGVGAVAEDAALEKIMERLGYEPINEAELFYQIEEAVTQRSSAHPPMEGYDYHRVITGINLQRKDLYWATRSTFRNLYANLDIGAGATKAGGALSLAASLRNAKDAEERTNLLMDAFIDKIANVLAVPTSTIQAGNPLSMYGLDSIVAVEFRKWFSQIVAVEVSLFDILGAKSIEALVTKVGEAFTLTSPEASVAVSNKVDQDGKPTTTDTDRTAKRTITGELAMVLKPRNIPMSTFQNRIWFLHNVLKDPSALNFTIVCYAHGQPKLALLQQALVEMVQRNDILRTAYLEGDEFAEQVVLDRFSTEIQLTDLSMRPHPDSDFESYVKDSRAIPLDIENGEVMRLTLAKLSDSRYAMVFVFHHIALDNGSTRSSMSQFTALYDAIGGGKELSLVTAPEISYSDFTLWHTKKLQSLQLQADIKWWREKFGGAPRASRLLPFAKSERPPKRSSARSILTQTLEAPLLKRMKRICGQLNATPFQFLLTAFRAFIHRYTQEDDLTLLMIDGNRPHPDLDDVLGFFVNIIPLYCRNDCDSSFDELLGDIKSTVLDALSHSQVPFDVIVDTVKAEKNDNHFPLGQITINYQMYGKAPKYKTADFEIDDVVVEDIPTASEIALEALEDPRSGLNLRFEYDSFLYSADDMERFLENFMVFLTSIIKDHHQTIDEIEMCGPKELEYLKANCWAGNFEENAWNNESVMSKVTALAKEQPQATAIMTSNGETITYEDLILKAGRISLSLRDAGLSPGQFVGILAQPGIDMAAAMMGVVQLRCGYVPLDPKFAKGRLTHIVDDSGISVILTGDEMDVVAADLILSNDGWPKLISISSAMSVQETLSSSPASLEDPFYVMYTSVSSCPVFEFSWLTNCREVQESQRVSSLPTEIHKLC